MGSWNGRGNQYIQFVRVLYCKLPTNGKQLPAFLLEAVLGTEPRPQRWEARVLPLCHRGPLSFSRRAVGGNVHDFRPDQLKLTVWILQAFWPGTGAVYAGKL